MNSLFLCTPCLWWSLLRNLPRKRNSQEGRMQGATIFPPLSHLDRKSLLSYHATKFSLGMRRWSMISQDHRLSSRTIVQMNKSTCLKNSPREIKGRNQLGITGNFIEHSNIMMPVKNIQTRNFVLNLKEECWIEKLDEFLFGFDVRNSQVWVESDKNVIVVITVKKVHWI